MSSGINLVLRIVVSEEDHDRLMNDQHPQGPVLVRRLTGEGEAEVHDGVTVGEWLAPQAEYVSHTPRTITLSIDGKKKKEPFSTNSKCAAAVTGLRNREEIENPVSLAPGDDGFTEAAEYLELDLGEEHRDARHYPELIERDDKHAD